MHVDAFRFGRGGVSLISKEYAASVGRLHPAKKGSRSSHQIAPGIVIGGPVFVTDMIMDGNLGQPFLSRHIITLDLLHGRLWIGDQLQMPQVSK